MPLILRSIQPKAFMRRILFCCVSVLLSCLLGAAHAQSPASPPAYSLFLSGKAEEAERAYAGEVARAKHSKNPQLIWQALMGQAWFENLTGDYENSIKHSNEAIKQASQMKNSFMIGRSLCWLGWAWGSMGLYQLATDFYNKAIELGAPNGEIRIVPVWGLATQELGYTYFKMGDTKGAKELLQRTTDFARENGISVGVAEGGAHLAEIALQEGNYSEAEALAREAVQAAKDCGCSPHNTARALVVLARVSFEQAGGNSDALAKAKGLTQEALEFAEKYKSVPNIAQAKLILVKLLPPSETSKREALVLDAIKLLQQSKSELTGMAQASAGRLFVEQQRHELASFYLSAGLAFDEEHFRTVDSAHTLVESAALMELKQDDRSAIEALQKAVDKALSGSAIPLALDAEERLASAYVKHEFYGLAGRWYSEALALTDKLLAKDSSVELRQRLVERRIALATQLADIAVLLHSVAMNAESD